MSRFYTVFKWLIVIAAYLYLGYRLITFNQYEALITQWKLMPISQFWWLLLVLIIMPINWLLESIKWKILTSKLQQLTIFESYKAVLAGISTGFFTPNRIGEMVGKVVFLKEENRKTGVTLSLVSSLTQNMTMIMSGIAASIFFFNRQGEQLSAGIHSYFLLLLFFLIGFGILYFSLPLLSTKIDTSKLSKKIASFTKGIASFSKFELLKILLVSLLRYSVFCVQFFFMLRFFNVELSLFQALMSIPATYLFVTFTPSVAFSEAAIRSSYAVMFIGVFSNQTVGIALAGICIWVINFVIPMLVGSVFLVKKGQ